jgi:hypothetical protein
MGSSRRRSGVPAGGGDLPLAGVAARRFAGRAELPKRSLLWFFFPVAFAFRLMYDTYRQLVPDEAFYWVLSRHLSSGYLDHPPMVAYVIRAGTYLLGFNEIGVRIGAAVMAFGSVLILLAVCKRMLADDRAVLFLGIIWLCSPLMAALATIVTPDTPSTFFSVCAMSVAILIAQREPSGSAAGRIGLWILFGIATGLAMLSKYTAVLPTLAVLCAVVTTPEGRRHLRTPWPWLAILVALAVFSPVISWNAHHDWASFRFQLHHGLSNQDPEGPGVTHRAISLGEYIAGQFGIWTPVLMLIGVVVLFKNWIAYRKLDFPRRLLLWSATVPLVFFGLAAVKSGFAGEANWPAFAYFPMSLLIVDDLHQNWQRAAVKWVRIGIAVALLVSIALQSPELLYKMGWKKNFPRKLNEFFGWKEMGRSVQMYRSGSMVVADRHQDAGELSFYMLPDQPDVWCYPVPGKDGLPRSRPTSFDYMPERPNLSDVDRVTYVGGLTDMEEFCRAYRFRPVAYNHWLMNINGRIRDREATVCERLPPGAMPTTLPHHSGTAGRGSRRTPTTLPADRE